MAQIILIQPDKTAQQLLSINLASHTGSEIIPRGGAEETIDLLALLPSITLIVTAEKVGDEKTAEIIGRYITNNKLETALMVTPIITTDNWKNIIFDAARILGIDEEQLKNRITPKFAAIPASFFLSADSSCCDVYLRIKKTPTEFQYIKRLHAHDKFNHQEIEKYIEGGLESFFILSEEQKHFATFLSNHLVTKLEQIDFSDQKKLEENIAVLGQSFDVVKKQIEEWGFSTATIQLTDAVVENMVKTFEDDPQVSGILHKIITCKSSFMYQHCHMIAIIAAECVKDMGDTAKDFQRHLAYAAFFHDMSLLSDEKMVLLHSYADLEKAELPSDKWDLVSDHANKSAALSGTHPDVHPQVEMITREHHGALNGKGFPAAPDPRIQFLSKVFMVAESFVMELYRYQNSENRQPIPIINELYKRYPGSDMTSIINGLEAVLKRNSKE